MAFYHQFQEDATGAESTSYDALKTLATDDFGILKQLTFLYKNYHGDDPRLTSKESKIAMSAILQKLFYEDDRTAYYMGAMDWIPNLAVWMRFFDDMGDRPLGEFLGIKSHADLPEPKGGGISANAPVSDVFNGASGFQADAEDLNLEGPPA